MKTDTFLVNQLFNGSVSHDGWMHVCPLGEHPWTSEDGSETIIQVIDAEAVQMMANSYPLSVQDSMIDKEHLSMTAAGSTAAYGWGEKAENRADGVWVRSDWTPPGRAAVDGKEYKFNSPCFPRDGLIHLGGNRYRVTKLGRIALTNNPNLKGQHPLTNRRSNAANPNTKTTRDMDFKAILLSLLGLPADASDEQITAAISTAKGDKKTTDALNSRIQELQTQLANTDLDAHGITDAGQRQMFAGLLTNSSTRPEALKTLATLKPKAEPPASIHNRRDAPVPGTLKQLNQPTEQEQEAERTKAAWIGNRSAELKASNPNRAHRDCFSQAEAEFARK